MLLTEIDHVAIAVRDLEAAIAYYREAFGAEVEHREIVESDGVEALIKVADSYIQLTAATRPDSPIARSIEKRGEGRHHVGYRVDDCAAALEAMKAAGAAPIDQAPRPGSRGTTVAFVHPKGSFGTLIELVRSSRSGTCRLQVGESGWAEDGDPRADDRVEVGRVGTLDQDGDVAVPEGADRPVLATVSGEHGGRPARPVRRAPHQPATTPARRASPPGPRLWRTPRGPVESDHTVARRSPATEPIRPSTAVTPARLGAANWGSSSNSGKGTNDTAGTETKTAPGATARIGVVGPGLAAAGRRAVELGLPRPATGSIFRSRCCDDGEHVALKLPTAAAVALCSPAWSATHVDQLQRAPLERFDDPTLPPREDGLIEERRARQLHHKHAPDVSTISAPNRRSSTPATSASSANASTAADSLGSGVP